MSPLPSQLFSPASYSRLSHRIIAISIEYDTVSTNTKNHIGARWYSLPLRGQDSLSLLPGPRVAAIMLQRVENPDAKYSIGFSIAYGVD